MNLNYVLTFLIAFIISLITVPLMRIIAIKCDVLDNPKVAKDIKTHKKPIPYLGGISIWLGFTIALITIRLITKFPTGTLRNLRGIFIASIIILILGLIDDMKRLNFKVKFVFQILAAVALIYFNMKIKFIRPDYLSIICSFIWIIAITNAFNLIDVMDGLSSGVAVLAGVAFMLINSPKEAMYVNFTSLAISGACLGFLIFNFPPAKIFMGDTGSLLIGIIMASVSLGTNYSGKNEIAVFTPILILAIPLFDTLYISYKRYTMNKSIFLGSKDHFALRLMKMGYSKRKILIMVYLMCGLLCFTSYLITRVQLDTALVLYTFISIVFLLLARFFSTVKM